MPAKRGRKPYAEKDKKHSYNVYLKPGEKEDVINKHGSLTKAVLKSIEVCKGCGCIDCQNPYC
jgi:hypothetical protein